MTSIGPTKGGDLRFLLDRPRSKEIGGLRLLLDRSHTGLQKAQHFILYSTSFCTALHSAECSTGRVLRGGDGDQLDALSHSGESGITGMGWERLQLKPLGASPDAHCVCTQFALSQTGHHGGWNRSAIRSSIEDGLTGSVHVNVYGGMFARRATFVLSILALAPSLS